MKRMATIGFALGAVITLGGSAEADIKMGITGPITGPSADFGAQLKSGAEQAVEDINAAGGILGQKIVLNYGDDVADPKEGRSIANKFADDGVKFVIGPYNSGVTMSSSESYRNNGIVMITPSASNPRITEQGLWNVFRTCGRDDQQVAVAGNYILTKFKGKKVAIVNDKTNFGYGLAEGTKKALNKGGMNEVLFEGVNLGEKTYSALISKIKASGAELIFWGGLDTDAALIVRQMRDQRIKAPLMSGDGIATDEFASIGGPAVEGTLMTFQPDPRKRPEAATVVKKLRDKKFEPKGYTLYSYAAVEIIKQAAEQAKSLDPKKVADVIHSGKRFKTVIGELSYDKNGDVTRPDYVMYVWKRQPDGKITYVEE
ncbi:MAG TPA: branched-chain amino acid ABC transporter substrate-binding protein [Bradyrhizobium sp.]|jgi:branched-chain amino acid transport system substrate-binding protein|nr:branched-chain amino acid ABC transporter substrate-binding protein [Bradyrhizobium sp.]